MPEKRQSGVSHEYNHAARTSKEHFTCCLLRQNLQKKEAVTMTTTAPITIATMTPAAKACAGEVQEYVVV